MKITRMQVFVVDADWRNWVFVKLFTDEGLTGVGEASLEGGDEMVVAALRYIEEYLLGKSPFEIERHRQAIYYGRFWRGMALLSALGGVEQALWDIVGKACGTPVYNLLGGACRDRMRCYTHISEGYSGHSVARRAEEAAQAIAEGWTALKWDPLPAGAGPFALGAAEVRYVVEQLRAVREAVGDEVELMIELHGRLDPNSAIRLTREIEPFRPYFLEEPTPPENPDALARVAAQTRVPLAVGERVLTKEAFWPLLERQCVDFVQPDVIHVGGLLECKKIAALAETRGIGVAPHNPNGPVCVAATLHLVAGLPNFAILEMPADDYKWSAHWRDEFLVDPTPVQVRNGYLELPTSPGLGIELNEEALARRSV